MRKTLIILLLAISVVSFAQVNYTIEDSVRVSTECVNDFTPVISFPRGVPTNGVFRNNSITYCNPASYLVMLGEDGPNINDNTLDGAQIYGNYLKYTGTNYSGVMHGLMGGYNINQNYKWNYFDGVGYCIVYKAGGDDDHDGMTNTSGGTQYNIIKNTMRLGMKGVSGTRVYNNTFYTSWSARTDYPFVKITPNNDEPENTPLPPAQGTQIKNNIFYSTNLGQKFYEIEDTATSFVGFVSDYNIFYVEGGSASDIKFQLNGGTWINFTQWQALGFDEHSQVLDPDFIDTINFAPSARLDYGTDLGASYDEGLAVDAEWVHGITPATAEQNGDWQVGATLWETSSTAHYVATDGNDGTGDGSISNPWATIQKAFSMVVAGDTVYFRGGIYTMSATNINYGGVGGDNGTSDSRIYYMNYPGETPIFDFTGLTAAYNYGIILQDVAYLNFKGLTFRNLHQRNGYGDVVSLIFLNNASHVRFDNCVFHDCDGKAVNQVDDAGDISYVEYYNCDSYNNTDHETGGVGGPGSMGTGFSSYSSSEQASYVYYYGCRAWQNSDQGWTTGGSVGQAIIDHCWSFDNGTATGTSGEGIGFKIGYMASASSANPNVRLTNSIAAFNDNDNGTTSMFGLSTNDCSSIYYPQNHQIYNNFFYHNGSYGVFICNPGADVFPETYVEERMKRIFKNNVSYDNTDGDYTVYQFTSSNNTWDAGSPTVTDDDFVNLDISQLQQERQSDGSLPEITFGKLAEGSDLIDAGTDVGLDYNGSAPDMGWFESESIDSTATDILTFTLAEQTGAATINATNHTVSIEVDYTADITDLTPTITLSYGATIIPLSGVSRDFTSPLPYTVTALDGVTYQEWTVTVTQEAEPEEPPVATTGSIVRFRGMILKR